MWQGVLYKVAMAVHGRDERYEDHAGGLIEEQFDLDLNAWDPLPLPGDRYCVTVRSGERWVEVYGKVTSRSLNRTGGGSYFVHLTLTEGVVRWL